MEFKVACLQFNNSSNMEANLKLISTLLMQAKTGKAELSVLPENCFLMPKNGRELDQQQYTMAKHPGVLLCQKLAKELTMDILIGSIAIRNSPKSKLRNRSVYIDQTGKILGYYDKMHLFDVYLSKREIYMESNRIAKGHKFKVIQTRFGGCGLSICYDLRFSYLYRKLALIGADFITVPAAFTYTTGQKHWHVLLRARAIETGCFVFAPALCGIHDNTRHTYGHSLIISPDGIILAEGDEDKNQVIFADINLLEIEQYRDRLGIFKNARGAGM